MMIPLSRTSFSLAVSAFAFMASGLAQPGAAQTTLERIREAGVATVGTEAAFPPFEFVDETGQIVGYGKDILTVVMEELGVELNQLDVPWQGILPGLLAGNFDFVATTVVINEDRARRFAFVLPIANGQAHVLTRTGEGVESEDDLAGMVVGTQLASFAEPIARALDERLQEELGAGFAELQLYTTFPESYVALANGEVDAVIQALPSLASLVQERPEIFEISAPVETGAEWTFMGWVTRPEDTDLRDFISDVIRDMRDDGRLYALQEKWFGFVMEIPDEGFLPDDAH
jgi:polar amino acid transport system substrate-binding protein